MNPVTDPEAWREISDSDCLERDPLVSVTISTYQHAPWIAECLESILAQQCTFPYEVIIGEDGSTDGTFEICEEFQRRYPCIIRLVTAGGNVGGKVMLRRIFSVIRGRYHALCEGDDRWCDPMKLQDQVAFLEGHPDCSLCFTRTRILRETEDGTEEVGCIGPASGGTRFAPHVFLNAYLAHTSSMVLRCIRDYPDWFWDPRCLGDNAIHLLCMEHGAAGFIDRITSVYRITGRGRWSAKGEVEQAMAIRDSTRLLRRHVEATDVAWRGLIECRSVLAEIKLGKALLRSGRKEEARRQWRDILAKGDLWGHPRLWWMALKLALRVR